MIFPEAVTTLAQYEQFVSAVKVPVLANITEFGATPLFTVDGLHRAGVGLVLYPLSAFRDECRGTARLRGNSQGWHAAERH